MLVINAIFKFMARSPQLKCLMGYSIFYPYRGMEGKFPGGVGVPETFSKGVRD